MVKPKFKYALLPLAICMSSGSVFAATNAELEWRLEAQEKEIKMLERQLKGTRGAVKQNRNRISDIGDRFKINGFFTGGFTTNDGDSAELAIYGIEDNYSTAAVSRLGLQMTFEVAKDMSLTGQLVSRGVNDYEVDAEWAYLSWNVTSNFTARIGRQRIPYYLLSEYLEVGYAYPWVRPPIELYNIPISSTDGIGVLYDFNVGELAFSTQAYVGAGSGFADQLEGDFTLNQAWGVAQFVEWRDFTFRIGYNTSNLDVNEIQDGGVGDFLISGTNNIADEADISRLPLQNIDTEYVSAALSYDNGKLLVMTELANLRVKDFVQPAGDSGYITVGYRFGDWMPHFTYAKFYTDSNNDEQVREYIDAALVASSVDPAGTLDYLTTRGALQTLIQQQTSFTLGVTYNINPRVKAKVEAVHYEDFGNYVQITDTGPQPVSGNGRFSGDPGAIDGHTAVYSFSIDAVF